MHRCNQTTVTVFASAAIVVLSICAGCTSSGGGAPNASPTRPINGLCGYIANPTSSELLVVSTAGAQMVSTPVQPASGQVAACDITGYKAQPADVVELSLSPTIQAGQKPFAKLQADASMTQENINGTPMVLDGATKTLYVRFTDVNQVFASSPRGTDSVLAVTYLPGTPNGATNYDKDDLAKFGVAVADEINAARVVNPPSSSASKPNLLDLVVPGRFCGVLGSVHVINGETAVTSSQWGQAYIDVYNSPIVYGNLSGNGNTTAAVDVWCDNGGGTADGQLAEEYVIFDDTNEPPRMIGAITPQQPSAPDWHITIFSGVVIQRGQIIAHEQWYRLGDDTCCPTGTATTTWTYRSGQLVAGRPVNH